MTRYSLGLTDASIVVLADRYGAKDILTLDERHFRAIRASDRRLFRLLPADE
jgi:predicted nucleic acid-binding protein